METRMKLAIETYAELTNRTFTEVAEDMQTSKLIQENIMKLMNLYRNNFRPESLQLTPLEREVSE